MSDLVFPSRILGQHQVILGKTGAGKSSALRHETEYLLTHKKRVCVIDPKGDWWGLKWSADGKSQGFPVIAFGDFKEPKATDIPINAQSGRHVAELIATGNRPCIIGFRGWMTSHMVDFWIDFASTLFNMNAGELYLVADEFHNFAPKGKIQDPKAGKCLHWSNRLLNEGRGLGLVCLIASQRPQKVHNDSLTACETLVAMRVIHKADRTAVKDWIDGCGDIEQGAQVLDSLASLKRGSGWVWSPENNFGPKVVEFPMFQTFDSFAPPQLQKAITSSDWGNVDLEAVKAKLASVIEEHKQNDPSELKRTVADLKRKLADLERKAASAQQKAADPIPVEIPVFTDKELKVIQDFNEQFLKTALAVRNFHAEFNERFDEVKRFVDLAQTRAAAARFDMRRAFAPATPRAIHARSDRRAPQAGNGDLSGGLKRMMIALAQRPGLTKKQLGVRAGLSSTSGTFGTYLGKLRSNGWVEGSEALHLTDTGIEALGSYDPLPEGTALLNYWLAELGTSGAARMLGKLAAAFPNAMTKEELGEAAQISSSSGTFGTYLGKLRTLELVEGRSELRAAKEFFE